MFLKNLETGVLIYMTWSFLLWQACLKKTKVKLELLTDYHILLMIWEGIRGGMCQQIGMLKQVINTWKIMIKVLSHHI